MWPFEGRDTELSIIRDAVGASATGAVLVVGPAGQGKTRLAREAAAGCGTARWIAATRAAAVIPLAAVLPLVPPDAPTGDPARLMQATAQRLRSCGSRTVIVADDAHLLDEASAALLAYLVGQEVAFLVLTARSGEPVPDALIRLLPDHAGQTIELAPLPADAVDRIIEHAHDGRVPAQVRRRLQRLSGGNPLALRELLLGAEPGGLTELVMARLAGVDEASRHTVELVACGEPLALALLESVVGLDAVSKAEDTGLIVVERSGARRLARLDHPLFGEVLRSRQTVSRATRAFRALSGALLATPLRRQGDTLLAALWQVEGAAITRPEVVRAGAWTAVGHADLGLAERLARAARDAEPGDEADRLLAEILAYRGRLAEAGRVLPATPPEAADERVAWAVTGAETRYWGDGDIAAALATLDSAGGHPLARASRSWLLFFDSRCAESDQWATGVLDDPDADPKAVIWAVASACASRGFLGRLPSAQEVHRRGAQVVAEHIGALPWARVEIDTGLCMALMAGGRPAAALTVARNGYRAALDGGAAMMLSGWALYGGLAAVARGHLRDAEQLLAEAQAGYDDNDSYRLSRYCRIAHAAAAALSGRAHAGQLLAEADQRAHPSDRIFDSWAASWRAWAAYADGDLAAALEGVRNAAGLARTAGMPVVEALALYDLVRLGAPADLTRLEQIPHGLARVTASAARALADRDGAADLDRAARALHRRGYDLLAAELFHTSAVRHRRNDRWAESDLAKAHATALSAAFPGARTPLLQAGELTMLLTVRERQVLLLAAQHTSAEIAQRLQLAVTTVNNNLARAYHKLGIAGRPELRDLLAGRRT